MKSVELKKAIEIAQKYHQEQLEEVYALIEKKKIQKSLPLHKESCLFGEWFYKDENFKNLLDEKSYENIDIMHTFWHNEYKKIYEIFYDTKQNSFFTLIFGNKKRVNDEMISKAKEHYKELERLTQTLQKALQNAMQKIQLQEQQLF